MTIAAEYYNITVAEKRSNPGMIGKVTIVALVAVTGREVGYSTYVSGKVEARKVAAVFRAQPWNF